jgi:catechol 2,3-dioxygenase-like lactoylglutathione lyase family enzyme
MQFVFQPLVFGFLLVLVPLLVHLINLIRHRKQPWAAMDFLLESYKKHRRWVLLKQWLLLLSRMLAMAALVAMLAGWISSNRWLPSWLGQQVVHHYVLLDDSYSMSDGLEGETAYGEAIEAIDAIVRQAALDNAEHRLTLLRWSRCSLATQSEKGSASMAADFLATSIPKSNEKFLDKIKSTRPTGLELSPESALSLALPVIEGFRGEQANLYIMSDFRRNQWERPETLRAALQPLKAAGAEIQLIDCVRHEHENLSVALLEPEQEVWVAGVPLFIEVQVRNHGQQSVRNVLVKPRTIEYAEGQVKPQLDQPYSGLITELAPVIIDQIPAGEVATRRFQVLFESPGDHLIEVRLPDDAVATDNVRACTLPLTTGQKVLLIDGDLTRTNAFYLEAALNPGAIARTGLQIDIHSESFLRDQPDEVLEQYSTIFMLDLPRLDEPSIGKLERYATGGGGVCFFVGDNADNNFYNERLYQAGQGVFPAEMGDAAVLAETGADEDLADLQALPHPVFGPLLSSAGSPFRLLRIQRYVEAKLGDTTKPQPNPSDTTIAPIGPEALKQLQAVQIVAKLRNGKPLILDKPFGAGRVMTVMTSLLPNWTSWAQDPTFVVFALRSVGYLGSFRRPEVGVPSGTPWSEEMSLQKYLPELEFLIPTGSGGTRLPVKALAQADAQGSDTEIELKGNATLSVFSQDLSEDMIHQLLTPGVIEAWRTDITGNREVSNRAFYALPTEGDLRKPSPSELIAALRPVAVKHRYAENLANSMLTAGLVNRDTLLMALLLGLLLLEQALAYSASFHPPVRKGGLA